MREDLRQKLGEALSDILPEIEPDSPIDWFDSRNIDEVLDRILPVIEQHYENNA